MKPLSKSLHKVLLLTTMLFAPSAAFAQAQQPNVETPVAAEDEFASDSGEEGEIVVIGNIPQPMRDTSEVVTILSAEELDRTGDSTASEALQRLTGLSVVSGRFVFVRGLGDRYSSALLNGSPLPSPEPLRRTVPLDLFPSNILDGAVIQKTFSPNFPGEFGGGVIDLSTVAIPNEAFLTLKVGANVNTASTARSGLIYHGSDTDWTGFDDGLRDIPSPLADAISQNLLISDVNFSVDDLETIGESFVNSPLTVIQEQKDLWPSADAEVSGGVAFDRGQFNIGLVGVAGYDSTWRSERAQRGIGSNQGGIFTIGEEKQSFTTTWEITTNALGSASIGWDENEISLTGLFIHSTSKEAQQIGGYDFNLPGTQQGYRESTGWYERQLTSLQLAGEHAFGPLELDWRVSQAHSEREAPYERSVNFLVDAIGPYYGRANDNSTRFSSLSDDVLSGGVDVAYTLPLAEDRDIVFSAGYAYSSTEREFEALTFVFGGGSGLPDDVARARVDYLFSPDNIDPLRFELFELTGPDDAYVGELTVNAGYGSVDIELMPELRAAVGVRYEQGEQEVVTFNRYGALSTAAAPPLENEYWLPAATMTWNVTEDMQLRLGYSQTIARPQFRELALSPYSDPDTDRNYRGNPYLVDSELKNYDVRLEYYLGANQFVMGSLFYKEIENPIEEVVTEPSTFNYLVRFINAPGAIVEGGELEYRVRFDAPFEFPGFVSPDLLLSANYTYTRSEIRAGAGDLIINPLTGVPTAASAFGIDGSQLQGTPENIVNFQVGLEDATTQLTLLVGWVDTRILQRGFGQGGGLPDILEEPGVNVDLVWRHDLTIGGREVTLGISGRNLLDEEHREYQDGGTAEVEVNTFDRGRTLSASVTTRF